MRKMYVDVLYCDYFVNLQTYLHRFRLLKFLLGFGFLIASHIMQMQVNATKVFVSLRRAQIQ